jgi:hypothetical protein
VLTGRLQSRKAEAWNTHGFDDVKLDRREFVEAWNSSRPAASAGFFCACLS